MVAADQAMNRALDPGNQNRHMQARYKQDIEFFKTLISQVFT